MATENAGQGVEMTQENFNIAKSRIANCEKFKKDRLEKRTAYMAIRDAENIAGQDGTAPILERVYHAEGYTPQIINVAYHSPRLEDGTREVCEEPVVLFVKASENYGEYTFLSDTKGKPLTINSDLYDARIESNRHGKGINFGADTVPQLGVNGEINGIVTLFYSKSTNR